MMLTAQQLMPRTKFNLNEPDSDRLPRLFYILKRLKTALEQVDARFIEVAPDVFLVSSRSRIGVSHQTDLRMLTCDCEDYTLQKGKPEEEPPRPCWHLVKVALEKNQLDRIFL